VNKEQLIPILRKYLPQGSELYAADLMEKHKIQLRIKNPRLTKLGDYRPPTSENSHRISINRDLNRFAFLITFMHEVAHLLNFENSGPRVPPHGIEWKREFQMVSGPIVKQNILPNDVHAALNRYLKNPKASSCTDAQLVRTLRNYDEASEWVLVEEIPMGLIFETQDGRKFKKLEKMRTRFRCTELQSGKTYLVPGLMQCKPVINQ
jgi:SprT protein